MGFLLVDGQLHEELWYNIDGFSRYQVSSLGRVKSKARYIQPNRLFAPLTWRPERIIKPVPKAIKTKFRLYDDHNVRRTVYLDDILPESIRKTIE